MPCVGDEGNGQLSDAAFRKIVETMSIPILVIAPDGTITYFGGAAEKEFRAPAAEVVGRNIVEFLPPEQIDDAIATMGDLTAHEEVGLGVPPVYQILRPDGTGTWRAIGALPLIDDPDVAGVPMYFMAFDAQLHLDESLAALLAGQPLPRVLDLLARSTAAFFEAPAAAIHWGLEDGSFAGCAAWDVPEACLEVEDGPWHEVARTGEPQYLTLEELPEPVAGSAAQHGLRGIWVLPVPPHSSIGPAVLTIGREVDTPPVTAHESVIARCLRYVQLVLVRHAEHEQLRHLASHDPLTGTANRARFRDRLTRALETGGPAVLLYCDMDRFKAVNDSLGHQAGDVVLVELVRRLRQALRPSDELARIGGDEFTVLLRGDLATAEEVAARLVAVASQPFDVHGTTVEVGLSVGIAEARPDDTPDDLVRRADTALYDAKRDATRQIAIAS
jgi:diguanylate cyclase (GGDEF)-like protein/PAS domain S-box-containing protein